MKYIVVLLILGLISCSPRNPIALSGEKPSDKIPNEPGKCYAKCKVPDYSNMLDLRMPVYIGEDFNNPNVELREIVTQEAGTKWVKKQANNNCMSKDPKDCLVWCLVEVEEVKESYYTVIDTTLSDPYEWKKIKNEIDLETANTEWKEIVCHPQVTTRLIQNIQLALIAEGYNILEPNGIIDDEFKGLLTQYQLDNKLAVGQITSESLNHLGIGF